MSNMVKVHIPFKPRFKDPMLQGVKTWTSRTQKYGKPGDTFEVFDHEFEILKIERRTLADVAEHYKEEGCSCWSDFVDVWNSIHRGRGFNPWQRVYVHVFRRISI